MKHYLHSQLATRAIKVLQVGAGGTGSRMLEHLVCLHRALLALGHPAGIDLMLVDDDTVSAANIGRQAFYPCDLGAPKAHVLVNRANMAMGDLDTVWRAEMSRLDTRSGLSGFDLVIGAVDSRSGRLAILRGLERATGGSRYWLDCGNSAHDGQVVLGEVTSDKRKTDKAWRLPHAAELFPQLVQPKLDKLADDTPSCSLAEALQKQSLFINSAMSLFAANLLYQLFTKGEIEVHGAFVNLPSMTVLPIAIDHEEWKRMGVVKDGKRQKIKSKAD